MTFTEKDKLKALGIVYVFETSRPFGDYAACVVLDDGAGVSYGISQFTHRSGSLAAVVEGYLSNGGQLGKEIFAAALPTLNKTSVAAITKLSRDTRFKQALRAAAITSEMKAAQQQIAFERYLRPALQICEAKEFVLPLSLAVVYDSLNHGSFDYVSARVTPIGAVRTATKDAPFAEKKWITEYVRARDRWLFAIRRLRPTRYRTIFFLDQIAIGNWELKLPMIVHGFRLTESHFRTSESKSEPEATNNESMLTRAGEVISSAAERFDRVSNAVSTITTRKDAAKSLWTTLLGTVWEAVWATFGYLAGLPREVWIVVAVTAALLMLLYLYRQIELGRIRERTVNNEQ